MSLVIDPTRPRTLSRTPVRLHGDACVHAVPEPAGAASSSLAGAAAAGRGTARTTEAATAATITLLMGGHEGVRISAPQSERVCRSGWRTAEQGPMTRWTVRRVTVCNRAVAAIDMRGSFEYQELR